MIAIPEPGDAFRGLVRWLGVCWMIGVASGQQPPAKPGAIAADRIDYPPLVQEFGSPSGAFHLTVKSLDSWKTPKAAATLRLASGAMLWQRDLPHYHGPRRVLVTDAGQVLLVDEWVNVVSRYALTLIARDGAVIAQYSAEQIISLLAVPRRAISARARYGPWIADGPNLSSDAQSALFQAGGRSLVLRLQDGLLSARD